MSDSTPQNTVVGPGAPPRLRWPIHLQLLVPMVSVVLLASVLATAITTYWIARRVRNDQSEDLRRVAKTLGEASYPPTQAVLVQMRGYSGAEFVRLAFDRGRPVVIASTLPMEQAWLDDFARIAQSRRADDNAADSAERRIVSLGERDYLVDFVAVSGGSHLTGPSTLFILYPEDRLTSRIHQTIYPAMIAGLIATIIALGVAGWLARRFARPIHTLVAQTATIAQGDFTPMPVAARNDELRDLAESINRMTSQLADHQRQVRHNERLNTLGRLGASMAHQLRNAATGGRMAIELHRRDCPQGDSDESLDVALRQLRLMESYLRQFLSFGQPSPPVRQRVEWTKLVEEVLGLVRPSCVHAGIDLQFSAPAEPLSIEGDPESLRQLVTNLVLNAVDAAVTGAARPPRVFIEVSRLSDSRGLFQVKDTGPGPAASIHDQLFHSFVTTKPDGFGLGLFVASQIAERHGGQLGWRREGEMTCFSFEFPMG